MSFFGRPLTSIFDRNVAQGVLEGLGAGAVVGYFTAKNQKSEHPWRRAITTGAAWGATDLITESGINLFAPNMRSSGSVLQNALVTGVVSGATGIAEGYAEGKARGDANPWVRAGATGAAWAVLDGTMDVAKTPIRRLMNKFPR